MYRRTIKYLIPFTIIILGNIFAYGQKCISDIDSISINDVSNINYEKIETFRYVIYNRDSVFLFYYYKILSFQDFLNNYYPNFTDCLQKKISNIDSAQIRKQTFNKLKISYNYYKDTISLKYLKEVDLKAINKLLKVMQDSIYSINETRYENLNCSSTFYYPYFDITIFYKDGTKSYWFSDSQCDIILPWKREGNVKSYNTDINESIYEILPDFSLNKSRLFINR